MGRRKAPKGFRFVEDEFGELRLKPTRAEAKRRAKRKDMARIFEVVKKLSRRIVEDVRAKEDERFFEALDFAFGLYPPILVVHRVMDS